MWYTYTVNDTVSAVQQAVGNYYGINDISPDTFFYEYTQVPDASGSGGTVQAPLSPTLTITSYTDDIAALFSPTAGGNGDGGFTGDTIVNVYTLNSSYLGPLDYNYVSAEEMQVRAAHTRARAGHVGQSAHTRRRGRCHMPPS